MLLILFRRLATSVVARGVLVTIARGIGSAAASGIGWKLGADAYDAVKRWATVDDVDDVDDVDAG